jgi:hypothetical protein
MCCHDQLLALLEQLPGGGQEGASDLGQPDAARVAIEEPLTEMLLEALHTLGDRGLGHSQRDGGMAEVPVLRDRGEEAEMAQEIHPVIIAFCY